MFVRLGLTNVRRNLGRTSLAVIGAAMAAMIITSIISLSSGYPAMGFAAARAHLGGDIVIYASSHLVPPGALAPGAAGAAGQWVFSTLPRSAVCDLLYLHPELYGHGFLAPGGRTYTPIDIAALQDALAGNEHITGVAASLFLPVRAEYEVMIEDQMRTISLPEMVLRSRDFTFGPRSGVWSFADLLVSGQLPAPDAQAQAVVDAHLDLIGYAGVPGVGTELRLFVPAVSVAADGAWSFDYSRELQLSIEVAGHYEALTNYAAWSDAMGNAFVEELYWVTPQLQVSPEYFRQVFAAVSGGQTPAYALQLGVTVTPFSEVENIAAELQAMLPGYTVVSAPSQLNLAQSRGLPEAAIQAPLEILGQPTSQQVGMPVDLSRTFILLVGLIAALLLAANMLFLVAQRRREIGVLKALGARSGDVALMVLSEALALNLIGTLIGFGLIRIFATWTLFSNRIPWAQIGRNTLIDLGLVLAVAISSATLFGLLPALQMARLTSMEVLRNE